MNSSRLPQKRSFLPKIFKLIFLSTLMVVLFTLTAVIGAYYYFSKDLPQLDKIEDYRPPLVSEVFDTNNQKIGEFWSECRFLTPVKEVPDKMIKAFIATEDNRFFEHHGVDPWGIFRAFMTNLKAGHVVQGGSTITQQVTKALVLSPERTYDRKIKEAILATKIESHFSKEQILYLYLNQIFFGNRAYGVTAAARNYFHKNLKDLNLAEIAMIVGLSKAPSSFNPLINPERSKIRQHYVIDKMLEQAYISKKEALEAKQTPLSLYKAGTDKDFNLQYAPYFTEHVRRYIQEKYGDDLLYKGGLKIYTTASLDTLQAAQKAVDKGVREVDRRQGFRGPEQKLETEEAIEKFNAENHSKIIEAFQNLDRSTFHNSIEALAKAKTPLLENNYYHALILGGTRGKGFEVQVGNIKGVLVPETTTWAASRADQLKRGDVVEVKLYRKPTEEKSLKGKNKKEDIWTESNATLFALEQEPTLQGALFSYEPYTGELKALVGGVDFSKSEFNRATQALRQPGSSIKPLIYASALDKGYTPNTVIMDAPIVYEESPGKFWTPKNYGGKYSGPTSLRSGLVNSKNVVTVRMVMDIGTHYVDAYMRKLGITTPIYKYYSMALGANDVILADLSRAYGAFTTGGVLPEIYFIRKMIDPSGKIIEEHKPMDKKFIITWDTTQKPESAPPESSQTSKGQAGTSDSQPSAESQPNLTTARKNPEKGNKISWDEMPYNPTLLKTGEDATQKDQVSLSEYEKKILYGNYIPPDHVISPRTAATMVSLMQDVVKYGTGTRVLPLGKPTAGKTGTTNNATDAWFMGFTPTLLTGVWVGHDEKIKTIGRNETGGHVSAPIWLYYMTEATKKYPTKDFKLPPWIDLSQYQTPMEVVKIDSESDDAVGASEGGSSSGSGAEFFTKDL